MKILAMLTENVFNKLSNSTEATAKEACTILMVALGIKNSIAYSNENKILERLNKPQISPNAARVFQA
jgi:hypothetical protein